MKRKAISFAVCCVLLISFLNACQVTGNEGQTAFYKSDNVEVSLIKTTQEPNYVDYEWIVLKPKDAYTKNTAILTGEVSNVRYATVNYKYMETDVIDNITIFDVHVDKVLACSSDSFPNRDTISVGVGYNKSNYSEDLPIVKEGYKYLLFCYVTADNEIDVMELSQYVDCWISYPKDLLCEKNNGYYLTSDYFSNIPGAVNLAGSMGLTEKDADCIATINLEKTSDVGEYIKDVITSSPQKSMINETAAISSVVALKVRADGRANQLWDLLKHCYLIDEDAFEDYIQKTAEGFVE